MTLFFMFDFEFVKVLWQVSEDVWNAFGIVLVVYFLPSSILPKDGGIYCQL